MGGLEVRGLIGVTAPALHRKPTPLTLSTREPQ